MATLIWSHFLFNNWFYSTFYLDGCPYLVALFIQQLQHFLFNLNYQVYIFETAYLVSHNTNRLEHFIQTIKNIVDLHGSVLLQSVWHTWPYLE